MPDIGDYSSLAIPVIALENLLASSPTLQGLLAPDATEGEEAATAKERIHYPDASDRPTEETDEPEDVDAREDPRPRVIICGAMPMARDASLASWVLSGSLDVDFELLLPEEQQDASRKEQYLYVLDTLGKIMDELRANRETDTANYLQFRSMSPTMEPNDVMHEGSRYWDFAIQFNW